MRPSTTSKLWKVCEPAFRHLCDELGLVVCTRSGIASLSKRRGQPDVALPQWVVPGPVPSQPEHELIGRIAKVFRIGGHPTPSSTTYPYFYYSIDMVTLGSGETEWRPTLYMVLPRTWQHSMRGALKIECRGEAETIEHPKAHLNVYARIPQELALVDITSDYEIERYPNRGIQYATHYMRALPVSQWCDDVLMTTATSFLQVASESVSLLSGRIQDSLRPLEAGSDPLRTGRPSPNGLTLC